MRRCFLVLIAGLTMAPGLSARADDDHERARAAMEAGRIRPLAQLLSEIERRYVGQVVETDLDHDDDRWTYKFKLLPPSGRMYRVVIDAATGAVVSTHGPVQERP
jgi:uncharacterized membrane protein YkoI